MSSFSRNIHRAHYSRGSRALGAALAFALAFELASAAAAAGDAHRFVLTAYSDASGGAAVVAGHYRAALEELNSPALAMDFDSAAVETNRCIAYSMTLQWREARAACDAAVLAASGQKSAPQPWSWKASPDQESMAIAYANRAVMHWLVNEGAAARRDLAQAQALSPEAEFVSSNLAALKVRSEMAQAGTPAPKS